MVKPHFLFGRGPLFLLAFHRERKAKTGLHGAGEKGGKETESASESSRRKTTRLGQEATSNATDL